MGKEQLGEQNGRNELNVVAGTIALTVLLIIGGIGVVMAWAAMVTANGAVRP